MENSCILATSLSSEIPPNLFFFSFRDLDRLSWTRSFLGGPPHPPWTKAHKSSQAGHHRQSHHVLHGHHVHLSSRPCQILLDHRDHHVHQIHLDHWGSHGRGGHPCQILLDHWGSHGQVHRILQVHQILRGPS